MKQTLRLLMFAVIAISVTFTSCKKTNNDIDESSEVSTHSDDQSRFDNESDAAFNDANAAIESYGQFTGRPVNVLVLPCDATAVLDSTATLRRITITYDGTVCPGAHRTRLGVVVLTMPLTQHWIQAGAVLTTTFNNLKITRISDNKSITINGIHTITNVTGGRLIHLGAPGGPTQIVHEIASPGMTVTFDNGSQRSWQVAKRRTFTGNLLTSSMVITTIGLHTDGNITGISEWGTNRFGNPFVTSITAPMVIRQDCGFRLTSGQVTHQRMIATIVVTFGLDSAGNPTSCPAGVYYFKLVWTGTNGIVRTLILPY